MLGRFLHAFALASLILALAGANATANGLDLAILHVNDSHSYLDATPLALALNGHKTYARAGGWARLKTAVDAVRAEGGPVLLLHAGDAVQGDLYFLRYDGRPEMQLLDRLGFDALVPGNHEFDKGADFLAAMLGNTRVPVVAANVNARGVPALAARLRPDIVVKRDARRIGIVGLAPPDTRRISSPGPGIEFDDALAAARDRVAALRDRGVDIIILLTHLGLDRDLKLAAAVPGVDVVVGGHSHTLLGEEDALSALGLHPCGPYPIEVLGPEGDTALVVTAWKWGRMLGRLDVHFDDQGRIKAYRGRPALIVADGLRRKDANGDKTPLRGEVLRRALAHLDASPIAEVVPPAPDIEVLLAPLREGLRTMREDIVATAADELPHVQVPGESASGRVLPGGSLVAPLVCRAMLHKLRSTNLGADVFLQNAGGVRTGLQQGPVSVGAAYAMLPFANSIIVLQTTGAQLRQALEHGLTQGGGAFPYLGGARYQADMAAPIGHRATCVEIRDADGWSPLNDDRTYRLATNAFLAQGGDGYTMLRDIAQRTDTGFVDTLAFIQWLKTHPTLNAPANTGVRLVDAP